MEVTEVRVRLSDERDDKLLAFCSVTFDDCFVVRDIKIIRGAHGAFVAMPSRKITDQCPKCRGKNHLRARFCNDFVSRRNKKRVWLPPFRFAAKQDSPERAPTDPSGRAQLYADIAHPVHANYREELQRQILQAYEAELVRAQQPGYRPPSDVYPDGAIEHADFREPVVTKSAPPPPPPRTKPRSPTRFGEGIFP